MSVLAVNRPSDVEFPLFLHVLGAILLLGALLVAATALIAAWRRRDAGETTALTRVGLWTILLGVFPAYVLMRVGAEWTEAASDYPDAFDPAWLGIGYITADLGALVTLIAIVLAIIGLRRLREPVSRAVLGRVVASLSLLLIAAYAVAVWAMTAKPT